MLGLPGKLDILDEVSSSKSSYGFRYSFKNFLVIPPYDISELQIGGLLVVSDYRFFYSS